MKGNHLVLASLILFTILISSCTPMNKITYLNEGLDNEWNISPTPPKHSLEIGDILVVKVLSFDEETTNFFNVENNVNSANSSITSANIYLNGFKIDLRRTLMFFQKCFQYFYAFKLYPQIKKFCMPCTKKDISILAIESN